MIARSSSVSLPGLVSTSSGMRILPMSCSRPATPIARISLRPAAERLGQSHRQHRDVQRMRRRVLIELLELEQRQHHPAVAVHRHRQRPHDRLGLEQRDRSVRPHLGLQPAKGLGLFAEREVQRRHRQRGAAASRSIASCPCRPTAPNRMPSDRICRASLGIDRRQHQPREHLVKEAVEFVARHLALELQALNAGGHQPLAPVPGLELAQVARARTRPRPRGT